VKPYEIIYAIEASLDPEEFIDVLKDSTLGKRRPVEEMNRIRTMCKNANLIVTARENGRMVGIARALTDYGFCTYLSDLAVRESYQRQGIGKALIKKVAEAAPQATLILLSAPAAVDYYPKIGMTKHPAAFVLKDINDLK
jgi:predicted N-acetyltransferase YhbS